eukprot:GDKH01012015.1.p1 GENE.GDKH01012015.1~~GDKH01012015.1.p1  ORF type:complete len:66 (+),score=5.44 GDKH01012015.1:109-306(+)
MLPRRLLVDAVEHVRLTESLMHRWSHHLNLRVQDYTGSGILGGLYSSRFMLAMRCYPLDCDYNRA